MNIIGATTIAKLIESHLEKDETKFFHYVNFIVEIYEQQGAFRAAKIIRSRLDGSYLNDCLRSYEVTLDEGEN